MPKSKPLYIDADGVRRGYYVYLHRQQSNGEVFYVGKGHGKRAWDKKRRHEKWLEKVNALCDDWEVVILYEDLSELQAFPLEEELTVRFGGAACDAGTLVNRVPGGETPITAAVTVDLGERFRRWTEVYETKRKFHDLSQNERSSFVGQLLRSLDPILSSLEEIQASDPPEVICDSILDLDCIAGRLIDNGRDLLKRRISWQDFALRLEEAVDDLQPTDIAELHRSIRPLAREAAKIASASLAEIDSGNREEAEAAANQAVQRAVATAGCQDPNTQFGS